MTYNVFGGTLTLTLSLIREVNVWECVKQMYGWLVDMYEMSALQCAVVRSDTADRYHVLVRCVRCVAVLRCATAVQTVPSGGLWPQLHCQPAGGATAQILQRLQPQSEVPALRSWGFPLCEAARRDVWCEWIEIRIPAPAGLNWAASYLIYCFSACLTAGWPPNWKIWTSLGISKWSGKGRLENPEKSGNL